MRERRVDGHVRLTMKCAPFPGGAAHNLKKWKQTAEDAQTAPGESQ